MGPFPNATDDCHRRAPPPLLHGEGLPPFEAIQPEHVDEHIPELMAQLEAELGAIEGRLGAALASGQALLWPEVMDPLHRLGERLRWSWGVVSHLTGVCNSPNCARRTPASRGLWWPSGTGRAKAR